MTAQDCCQAASLQLLGQRLNSFHPTSGLPFLAFCSHWVLGSICLLSICVLEEKPGTSPVTELPLPLSSHTVRFVTPGHNGPWGLSEKSDTKQLLLHEVLLLPTCQLPQAQNGMGFSKYPSSTGRQSLLESLVHTQTLTVLPVWQLCGCSLLGHWWS